MEKVEEYPNPEFKWLKKRGVGKNKGIQFYESFEYDGVKYMLYDCVYMYKEGLQEPYIGKLTKIWEHLDNKTKKVKVHWFFRPEEITKWIGETKFLENEVLFASGDGRGLTNLNSLEAIAGPCNVVCISKDSRNPQPSDKELKAADFIFYRTFDVQSCTILDKLDEEIGGLEIKYVFNREKGESVSPGPESTSGRKEENPNNTITSEPLLLALKNVPDPIKDAEKGETQDKNIPNTLVKNKTPNGSDNLQDPPFKKRKPDDAKPPKEKTVELEVARGSEKKMTDTPSEKLAVDNSVNLPDDGKSKDENKLPVNDNNVKSLEKSGIHLETGKTGKSDKVENKERKRSPTTGSDKLHDRPLKKNTVGDKKPANGNQVELEGKKLAVVSKSKHEEKLPGNVNNLKGSGTMGGKPNHKNGKISSNLEGKSLEKSRDGHLFKNSDSTKPGSSNKGGNGKDIAANSELLKGKSKSGLVEDSVVNNNKELKEDQPGESKRKLALTKSFKGSASTTDRDNKTSYQEFECGPKPNSEKDGWFRRPPWEELLKNAHDQGAAILLYNVDPDYTSADVEGIIWHAFTENCDAKILQSTALSSPHYAQALVLFKTNEAAKKVLNKLDEECLMLKSNGRPLVGTRCPPLSTKGNSNFFGHLDVYKAKNQYNNREDEAEAVSTSHPSQPNNIEYDMAMEWCLLQKRSSTFWEKFHKQQKRELEKQMTALQK
ncbi:protein ANTI-SILENCING 1 [Rutidosis leptorrhynchoides]|uniref:protein ANTI-SILENCING 1 n=1 Tax=Rutidosis leptorrhynchoides TaxID=125765 RepID=UPI003A993925